MQQPPPPLPLQTKHTHTHEPGHCWFMKQEIKSTINHKTCSYRRTRSQADGPWQWTVVWNRPAGCQTQRHAFCSAHHRCLPGLAQGTGLHNRNVHFWSFGKKGRKTTAQNLSIPPTGKQDHFHKGRYNKKKTQNNNNKKNNKKPCSIAIPQNPQTGQSNLCYIMFDHLLQHVQ